MDREAPPFKRCCFCLPLRRGLIAWGYAKVGFNILMLTYSAWTFYFLACYDLIFVSADTVIYIVISACSLIDISFNIAFIVAGHKKSIKMLKVSYVYNMVCLGLLTLVTCFILYSDISFIRRMWPYIKDHQYTIFEELAVITGSLLGISMTFLQTYVVLLIRSEMTKLHNQTLEIQYRKHAASEEPLCTLHNVSDTNHCTDKKQ